MTRIRRRHRQVPVMARADSEPESEPAQASEPAGGVGWVGWVGGGADSERIVMKVRGQRGPGGARDGLLVVSINLVKRS